MKKLLFFSLFFFSIIYNSSFVIHNPLYADDVTILTYYPAPYGVYQTLKATNQVLIGQDTNGLPLTGGGALLSVGGVDANISSIIYTNSSRDDGNSMYGVYAVTTNNAAPTNNTDISYGIYGLAHNNNADGVSYGVRGETDDKTNNSAGVYGRTTGDGQTTYGVYGTSENGTGVFGFSTNNEGIYGESNSNVAIHGISNNREAILGESTNYNAIRGRATSPGGPYAGVIGQGTGINNGIYASSEGGIGVLAITNTGQAAVFATAGTTGYGVYGSSTSSSGIYGQSRDQYGVCGISTKSYGVYGKTNNAVSYAGYFEGKILMTSDSAGGTGKTVYDVAELIPCSVDVEYTDVVVINPDKDREVMKCNKENRVTAGIISENPILSMGDREKARQEAPDKNWNFLALAGQVMCKVDASYGEIKRGDLLATSPTPGHAMKAKPIGEINGYPIYHQGCIVGKALEPLKEGKGKILALVCLM